MRIPTPNGAFCRRGTSRARPAAVPGSGIPRRYRIGPPWGHALITVAASAALAATCAAVPAGSATGPHDVLVRRTGSGIPHIQADNDHDLGYGEGYAFAQDNPCALVQQALTLSGDRSRWFGPTAPAPQLALQGASPSNLASDEFYRALNAAGAVDRLLAAPAPIGPTPEVRAIVDGYVAGYNRYLADQRIAHLPDPACRGAAWMRPVTAMDVWRRAYQLGIGALGGTGTFMPAIVAAAPPTGGPSGSAAQLTGAATQDASLSTTYVPGSNALALGSVATGDHHGMVLANPHAPWNGSDRFYQMQLTIPGRLDVSGATFYGIPLIMPFGHTQHLAFTATRASDTQYTIERLRLAPGDPTSYLVDGVRHPMIRQHLTVPVAAPDGRITNHSTTLYRTTDGPVIQMPGIYDWTATTAYVIHDAQADNLRTLDELLAIDKSESLTQLQGALRTFQALPTLNV